jgi:hypothetical protein
LEPHLCALVCLPSSRFNFVDRQLVQSRSHRSADDRDRVYLSGGFAISRFARVAIRLMILAAGLGALAIELLPPKPSPDRLPSWA